MFISSHIPLSVKNFGWWSRDFTLHFLVLTLLDPKANPAGAPHSPPFLMAFSEFRPLNESSLIEYIKTVPSLSDKLGNKFDDIKIKEVGDGNLNFVYIVVASSGSFVIKQVT